MELVLALARAPEWLGYPLSRWGGLWFASQRNDPMVRAVRANQRVIGGERLSEEEIDQRVRAVFVHGGRCMYDYYHLLSRPEKMLQKVAFSPELEQAYQGWLKNRHGVVVVGPHMSNFDLVMRAMAYRGLKIQVLSYPAPPESYQIQNALRQETGLEVTPFSPGSMRQAITRLQEGGIVITGMDRPGNDTRYHPWFFERPSAATVAYIRLALKAQVPVVVLGNQMRPDGVCYVQVSEPVHMRPYPDLETEVVRNAETALEWASKFICDAPEQWLMYYPVWPETLEQA